MKMLERILICLLSPYLMFSIIDYKRGAYFNLFSHLPFRMDSFVDGNIFSFCYSID